MTTSLKGTRAVLLLDPVRNGAHFKSVTRRRGLAVVSVYTMPRQHVESRWPDHADGDDAGFYADDAGQILHGVESLGVELVAVVAASESAVHLADVLADKLGLTGNDLALSPARRNKAAMRAAALDAGVRIPRFALVEDPAGIAPAAAGIGFPAIAKHTTGGGSHGARLLNSAEEAADISGLARRDHFGREVEEWLVEQYVRGRELAVNCFSHDGEHQVIDVWEYRQPDDSDYAFPYWELMQLAEDDPDRQRAADFVGEVLTALGVRLGPSHTEVKVAADGVYLIEMGARLPGGPLTEQWLAHSDLDPFEQTLDCYLGNRPACLETPPRFDALIGSSVIRNEGPAGVLTEIRGMEELLRKPGVDSVASVYAPGDVVPVTDSTKTIPLFISLAAPDRPALLDLMAWVRRTVELVIEPATDSRDT
ncbi:ATP-grasp domain-containing protein [Streptomyces sp. NPDC058773]|uniref:ATP-grasp domain-containing protein n=1 Tax=Streptomyces sp. NPDC058773 TaxID=3346632 RepID=UPI0036C5D1D0